MACSLWLRREKTKKEDNDALRCLDEDVAAIAGLLERTGSSWRPGPLGGGPQMFDEISRALSHEDAGRGAWKRWSVSPPEFFG